MKRTDAAKLIGTQVSAWTAANGEYVGELIEVFGGRWRGKVRITGVIKCATHCENGAPCRRGFRPGETIEVGGANIKPTTTTGTTYREALEREIVLFESFGALTWATQGLKALRGKLAVEP